ncbi:MAG TPA: plastocyanin/azurin family copper-binding protein [Thermoplasmata archaeon]|nr:plastocyanin/azurin family copper-binding protein [Thermoplasmata archaeon]
MRTLALIMSTFLMVAVMAGVAFSPVQAQVVPTPTLNVFVFGETVGGRQVFSPAQILIPQVPVHLVVTFHNNDTMQHTFSMNDVNGTTQVTTNLVDPGVNVTVEFTVASMTQVVLTNGTRFTPEAGANGILFYCLPHRGAGMTGQIVLASVPPAAAEKGILLRAYWIGIIGIAVTLVWVGVTYYVIKSSSRHFVDHSEHVRKGLP